MFLKSEGLWLGQKVLIETGTMVNAQKVVYSNNNVC
jgi:hypothetical protein